MTLALGDLADHLKIARVAWDIRRLDELSGSGDSRFWQAEMADPVWTGEVTLAPAHNATAKQIAARVRSLRGAATPFFLYDPLSRFPQADPDGAIHGASTVTVLNPAVDDDRSVIRLQGMPAGYVLTLGDKLAISYASETRWYFGEVAELAGTVTADGSGQTPAAGMAVFPHLPVGIAADAPVTLIQPAARVIVEPGSFHPGTAERAITRGAGFTVIQKV